MRTRRFLPAILALSAALLCSACNKSVDVNNATDQSWNESEVNGLFKNVPADSPLVFATTLKVNLNHPSNQAMRTKFWALYKNALIALSQLDSIREEFQTWDTMDKKLNDYGFDTNHLEAVAYIRDASFVIQFTVKDANILKTKIIEKIQKDYDYKIEVTEIPVGTSSWSQFEFYKRQRAQVPRIAVKFDNDLVTVIPVWSADQNSLAKFEQPVAKGFDKSKLGKIENDMFAVGFIDNQKALSEMLKGDMRKLVENAMEKKFSTECDAEIIAKFKNYPTTNLNIKIDNSGSFSLNSALTMADNDEVQKINSLKSSKPTIINKNSKFGLQFSMKIPETIDYAFDYAKKHNEQSYKCEDLQEISEKSKDALRDARQGYFFVKSMLIGLTGISVNLENFYDLNTKSFGNIDSFAMRLEGPAETIGTAIDLVSSLAAPSLESLNAPGKVVPIDLNESLDIDIKGNSYLSDKNLTIATSDLDVQKLSSIPTSPSDDFISTTLSLDAIMFDQIKTAIRFDNPQVIQDYKTLFSQNPVQLHISTGVKDNKLTFTQKLEFLY